MSTVARPMVFVDGSRDGSARVSVHDEAVLRGTGVFEVVGVGANRLIGLDEHVLRILRSLSVTGVSIDALATKASRWLASNESPPEVEQVSERRLPLSLVLSEKEHTVGVWLRHLLLSAARFHEEGTPPLRCGSLRMVITRGSPLGELERDTFPQVFVIRTPMQPAPLDGSDPRGICWSPPLGMEREAAFIPPHPELTLLVTPAPWHLSGRSQWYSWLHGAVPEAPLRARPSGTTKWLSYGPNMASFAQAPKWGGQDSLLVYPMGEDARWEVLEGTTFAALWHPSRASPLKASMETSLPPQWVTACPSRRDLLPSVTADLAVRAAVELGQPVSVGGSVVESLAADKEPCTRAWREGNWAYGASTVDALSTSVHPRAAQWGGVAVATNGGVDLLRAVVTSDEALALSSGKHVSAIKRLVVPSPLLREATSSSDAITAAIAQQLLERGEQVTKTGDPGRSAVSMTMVDLVGRDGSSFKEMASAYWSLVVREGTPVDLSL
jgi:hypothetical protein